MQDIKVHVVDRGRKFLAMRYIDPITGQKIERSTKKSTRKDAEKVAAKWEAEIQEGRYKSPSKVTWSEFRQRYEDEVVPGLAENTAKKIDSTLNAVEELIRPEKLASITSEQISQFQSKLRNRKVRAGAFDKETKKAVKAAKTPAERKAIVREFHAKQEGGRTLSESTIKSHLAHLQSALTWAQAMKMITEVPNFQMPKRAKGSKRMKGRPITTEEFERMLAKTTDVVGPTAAKSWIRYLRGLWLSGLRLEESLELYWDRDDRLCVDLSGRFAMLRIPAELEKGHQDRLLPIAPEFEEFLLATDVDDRKGRVFDPRPKRENAPALMPHRVGELVTAIGKKAAVKVNTDVRTGKVKYASAHDLRRSFGERWAARVFPQVLMELMRHESIETTMRFYVGRNAEATSETLRSAMRNTLPAGATVETPTENADIPPR